MEAKDKKEPYSIEWKSISSLFKRNKGINITAAKMKELSTQDGEIRIFAGGETKADILLQDIDPHHVIYEESVIVKSRGNIGFEYYSRPFSHKSELWSYSKLQKEGGVMVKFLYYYLSSHQPYFQKLAKQSSVKLPQLSVLDTDCFPIPIPPLAIQKEIVRILDTFSQLKEELKEELKLRQIQYRYYRDKLLDFGKPS